MSIVYMASQLHSLYMFSYILCGDGLWYLVKLNDSLEPVQFELFSKQIGGGAKVNIFQYSMILFCHDKVKGLFLVLWLICDSFLDVVTSYTLWSLLLGKIELDSRIGNSDLQKDKRELSLEHLLISRIKS